MVHEAHSELASKVAQMSDVEVDIQSMAPTVKTPSHYLKVLLLTIFRGKKENAQTSYQIIRIQSKDEIGKKTRLRRTKLLSRLKNETGKHSCMRKKRFEKHKHTKKVMTNFEKPCCRTLETRYFRRGSHSKHSIVIFGHR